MYLSVAEENEVLEDGQVASIMGPTEFPHPVVRLDVPLAKLAARVPRHRPTYPFPHRGESPVVRSAVVVVWRVSSGRSRSPTEQGSDPGDL